MALFILSPRSLVGCAFIAHRCLPSGIVVRNKCTPYGSFSATGLDAFFSNGLPIRAQLRFCIQSLIKSSVAFFEHQDSEVRIIATDKDRLVAAKLGSGIAICSIAVTSNCARRVSIGRSSGNRLNIRFT